MALFQIKDAKKYKLLENPEIKRWHDNLARGSEQTADVALRRLSLFCEQHNTDPISLVQRAKENKKWIEDLLFDHTTMMEKAGSAPGYIAGILKHVRNWLAFNDVEVKKRVKLQGVNEAVTLADERVPTQAELKELFGRGDLRSRAAIALVSQAGIRLEVLGNYSATDGLTIGDLPEMTVDNGSVSFKATPTMIVVRPSLSKSRHKYFSFLSAEGCAILKAYLDDRLKHDEEFTPSTPVIAVEFGYERHGKNREKKTRFVNTRNVSRVIREAMRPRFEWRPYVLRAYFDTQLLLSESHGKLPHDYRVFFMGHKGDIEAKYTVNKGKLPTELIEDMRAAYLRSEEYLVSSPKVEVDKKAVALEAMRRVAQAFGIDPMKVKVERQRHLKRELEADEELDLLQNEIAVRRQPVNSNGFRNQIVTENQLITHLDMGWEIVKEVSGGRYLIRKANNNY
jgi:hypothetical protein